MAGNNIKVIPNPAVSRTASGLDFSHYQPHVDWQKVALTIDFAFIKASEGTTGTDKSFAPHWAQAKTAGVLRGAYHFFHGNLDAATQADIFLKTMGKLDNGDLPPVLDLENSGGTKPDTLSQRASLWIQRVEAATNRKPIIYVSPDFWNTHMAPKTDTFPYADYPLWVAHYGVQKPSLPKDHTWSDWTFWQFSGSGTHAGVGGQVDLDKFNGSPLELWVFLGESSGIFANPITMALNVPAWFVTLVEHELYQIDGASAKPTSKFDAPPLKFPSSKTPNKPAGGKTAANARPRTYVVGPGDTVSAIASRFDLGMQELAQLNGIDPNFIRVGQVLRLS
jgi:GH25 family lysozyme M1 (1,4-beta-N-acetylmuramidase)